MAEFHRTGMESPLPDQPTQEILHYGDHRPLLPPNWLENRVNEIFYQDVHALLPPCRSPGFPILSHRHARINDTRDFSGKWNPAEWQIRLRTNNPSLLPLSTQRWSTVTQDHTRPQAWMRPDMVSNDTPQKVYKPEELTHQDIHASLPPLRIKYLNANLNSRKTTRQIFGIKPGPHTNQHRKIRPKHRNTAIPRHELNQSRPLTKVNKTPRQFPQIPPKDPKPPPWRPIKFRTKNRRPGPWENRQTIPQISTCSIRSTSSYKPHTSKVNQNIQPQPTTTIPRQNNDTRIDP